MSAVRWVRRNRRTVVIPMLVALALAVPSALAAQVRVVLARTEQSRLVPALSAELTWGRTTEHAPQCWGSYFDAQVKVGGKLFANARDNPGTLGVSARLGRDLDLACQGKLIPPSPKPIGAFDYGTIALAPSVSVASNQAGDEVAVAPGFTAYYLAKGAALRRPLIPDVDVTLAANRPLRSARRDSAGVTLAWERRWGFIGYWRLLLRDIESAGAFAPIRLLVSAHAWHLNAAALAESQLKATGRVATDATLHLRAPRRWASISSIDVSWQQGRLPEQPERRSAVGVGVTLK